MRFRFHPTWTPPPVGVLNFNFDAAFKDGCTTTGCVLRNHLGIIVGAWVNCFVSDKPFCAETEAAIQTFKLADGLDLIKVCFEGDASNVILSLKGLNVEEGRPLLASKLFWNIDFVPRDCNSTAHFLAKWAVSLDFCGPVPSHLLDPSLWGASNEVV